MFTTVRRKLMKSLQTRGIGGTALFALREAYQAARRLTPAARRALRAREAAEREFDLRYNVDTAGFVPAAALAVDSANWVHATRYEASHPAKFHEMMAAAGDVAPGRAFVDFGCGKGRGLFLAAEYRFRYIVGVEFSPPLVEVARKNLVSYRNPRRLCRILDVVLADAALFVIPDDPLVLFFYNPFSAEVLARVVDNLRRSLERRPRPVTVIYSTPEHDDLWAAIPALRKASSERGYSIYHATGSPATS
jgi:protein-L-isoaspartate O-methyltransferase